MKTKDYWEGRYRAGHNSGYGSYGEQLKKKLDWIVPLDFNSISEYGCGDFNFGRSIIERHPANYTGMDISEHILATNRMRYPRFSFLSLDKELPKADLVMCVDVLFHVLEDEEVEKILERLEKAWTRYLVITAYERDEKKTNHVRIRKFDYKRFGEPILRGEIEADGNLMFYIWKK